MKYTFFPLNSQADTEEIVRRLNEAMFTLVDYLDSHALGELLTPPSSPFPGMIVYTADNDWSVGGGPGVYFYARNNWRKLGGPAYPKQTTAKDIVYTANVYNMIGGDITDPPTVLRDTGSTAATTVNIGGVGEVSEDSIGVYNGGFNACTVNFGAGRVIVLQHGDAVMLTYDGAAWVPQ